MKIDTEILTKVCTLTHNRQMKPSELAESCNITARRSQKIVESLKSRGYLRSAGHGLYFITRLGMDEIPAALRQAEFYGKKKKSA
jgi:predicted transcriptional regulator